MEAELFTHHLHPLVFDKNVPDEQIISSFSLYHMWRTCFPFCSLEVYVSPLYWFHAWSSVLMTAEGPVDRVLERGMFMCSLSHEPTRRCSLTTHHTYLILTIHWMAHVAKGNVS